MAPQNIKFSILITTKNRVKDLLFTLKKIERLINLPEVECIIFDDGSTDGTSEMVKTFFPKVALTRNETSKGYLFCRNKMLNETTADFAISLDDDAHFVSDNPLEEIKFYFDNNPKCGLIAFRIFWGLQLPESLESKQQSQQAAGFVGCGHAWRMTAWRDILNYPEWFEFYGEEDFAAYQLHKKSWQIHYLPQILVQHRVDMKARKNNADHKLRARRSLRAGWFLYLLFYPKSRIPKIMVYSVFSQIKKGKFSIYKILAKAGFDVIKNSVNLFKNSNRLTDSEFARFKKLASAKIYWTPENDNE